MTCNITSAKNPTCLSLFFKNWFVDEKKSKNYIQRNRWVLNVVNVQAQFQANY